MHIYWLYGCIWKQCLDYYIEKLNNGEYLNDRKHLSIKYGFKCAKQPLGSLHCGYYVCEHIRTCGKYKVNREDVSFMYLYSVSPFFSLLTYFFLYCISILIIGWNGNILYNGYAKWWSRQCYIGLVHVLAPWDLPCRRRILRQEWDINGVSSTMYLWKTCYLNIWCNLEFWTIWKCYPHAVLVNIVKYLAIWVYVNILYEFESCMNFLYVNPIWIWISMQYCMFW
jgi:hypothetical protein